MSNNFKSAKSELFKKWYKISSLHLYGKLKADSKIAWNRIKHSSEKRTTLQLELEKKTYQDYLSKNFSL